jgi:glycine oxidase
MANPSRKPGSALRVAVIGAGAVGLSAAFRLKQAGAEVAVYDRGLELGAGTSRRSAGMLSAAFESAMDRENRALVAFAQHASRIWPEFAAEIERLGGGGIEFAQEGSLVCATDAADEARLEELATACQARDIPARWLKPREAVSLEPGITGPIRAALHLPDDRQVEPPLLLQRLGAALQRIGVGLRFGRQVERIGVASGGGFVMADNERFDRVLLATGAGPATIKFADRFGEAVDPGIGPIIPVKGQMAALAPVSGAPKHVIRLGQVYIAPKSRWILVGATVERGKSDTQVDPVAIARLKAQASAVCGALKEAPEVSAWAGVRPGTPDDAPMIGATRIPGLFAALGCFRNGILFSPAAGELAAAHMLDGKVSAEGAAFSPLRFDKLAPAPHSR